MRAILAVACAAMLTSCSFLFVDGPSSSTPPQVYPSCDEGNAMPYIDAVIAGLYLAVTATALADGGDTDATSEIAPGSIAAAALFGTSAWIGFGRTGRCREKRQDYRAQFGDPRYQQPMMWAYPAQEGQACHPQAGCQPGLVCGSGLCVRPPSYQQPPITPGPAPIQPGPIPQVPLDPKIPPPPPPPTTPAPGQPPSGQP